MSIIKDGKVYRTLEEQVYHLTKDNKEINATVSNLSIAVAGKQDALTFDDIPTDGSDNPVKSNGIYDALATKQNTLTFDNSPTQDSSNPVKSGGVYTALSGKQDTLTSSSLEEGTLDKAIGFDSQGNLIKGVASGGGSDDYNDLNNIPITNQTKVSSYNALTNGQSIYNGDKLHLDITIGSSYQSFLENLDYTDAGGMGAILAAGNEFNLFAYNLTSMSMGYVIIVADRYNNDARMRVVYGTTSGDMGDFSWTAGFNNLDGSGNITISLLSSETLTLGNHSGWNGTLISQLVESYTPSVSLNEFAHRTGAIGQNTIHGFKKVLVEGSITYSDSISENQTDAVQGGAIYNALATKQDVITSSSVSIGTANQMLALDGNGNLCASNLPSGKSYYRHNIQISGSGYMFIVNMILDTSNQISDLGSLGAYLRYKGRTIASGIATINSKACGMCAVSRKDASSIYLYGYYLDGSDTLEHSVALASGASVSDTVTEI